MARRSSRRRWDACIAICLACVLLFAFVFLVILVFRAGISKNANVRRANHNNFGSSMRPQRPALRLRKTHQFDSADLASLGPVPTVRRAALCTADFADPAELAHVPDWMKKEDLTVNSMLSAAVTSVVELKVCSVDPSGSPLTTAVDATDSFFDNGFANAISEDLLTFLPSGGIRFLRKESTSLTDNECHIIVAPLGATWQPCNVDPALGRRTALNATTPRPGLVQEEAEAVRSERLTKQGEYELLISVRNAIIRVRHVDGLRFGVTSLLQIGLHQLGIEHEARINDAAQINKFPSPRSSEVDTIVRAARGNNPTLKLPLVSVSDGPGLSWRGFMVDLARHHHTMQELVQVVKHMAWRKLNRLQLHLSDDQGFRLESLLFPSLARDGGRRGKALNGKTQPKHAQSLPYKEPAFLTIADARNLSDFAALRGVMIVPEIDLPGHSAAAVIGFESDVGAAPKYSARVVNNVSKQLVYTRKADPSHCNAETCLLQRRASATASAINAILPELNKLRSRNRNNDDAELPIVVSDYRFGFLNANSNPDCGKLPVAHLISSDKSGAPNCMAGTHGIMNPDNDGVLLMKALLAEVAAIFDRSDYIHIGGDQAESLRNMGWQRFGRDRESGETTSMVALQSEVIDELARHCRDALLRRPIVWDDALIDASSDYALPRGTLVALWREDGVTWADVAERAAKALSKKGEPLSVIFMGKTRLYLDYIQYLPPKANRGYPHVQQPHPMAKHRAVTFDRVYNARYAIPRRNTDSLTVVGMQACLWTELVFGWNELRYQMLPRLYALADAAWISSQDLKTDVLDEAVPIAEGLDSAKSRRALSEEKYRQHALLRLVARHSSNSQVTEAIHDTSSAAISEPHPSAIDE